MIWLHRERGKRQDVFGWAHQPFEAARKDYPHLHAHELTIYPVNPDEPVIEVLALIANVRLSQEQSMVISDTITTWLKENKYFLSDSAFDIWQVIYRKH